MAFNLVEGVCHTRAACRRKTYCLCDTFGRLSHSCEVASSYFDGYGLMSVSFRVMLVMPRSSASFFIV